MAALAATWVPVFSPGSEALRGAAAGWCEGCCSSAMGDFSSMRLVLLAASFAARVFLVVAFFGVDHGLDESFVCAGEDGAERPELRAGEQAAPF